MHSTQVHKLINRLTSFLRCIGIWHGEDRPRVTQFAMTSFYSIYYPLTFASLVIGAIKHKTLDGTIFLSEESLILVTLIVKLWILVFKQKKVMELLNRICVFSIRRDEEVVFYNNNVEKFAKFVTVLTWLTAGAFLGSVVFPFVGNTRSLVMDIAFPLDWKNSETGFWIAHIFFTIEVSISGIVLSSSVLIWYLLLHCSLRYKILGADMRSLGRQVTGDGKVKLTEKHKQIIFYRDLGELIKNHLLLKELIDELDSFLSNLFLLQFATSGLCICSSIYCFVFITRANYVEEYIQVYLLCYAFAELFMITYLGNEIMLSSSCLTYNLFESQWIDQPHATKKCIIVFAEYLKQSHQILIGKLYPLTLETFTRILKSAYTLFNILKNTKQ